ncbi:MAG: TIM barrel protein [Thermoplasmata archaeon]
MIRFGPAGIPLSCKGRTLRDGISDVHHLGLAALEAQFIKVNPIQRVAFDEEVGRLPREIPQQLIVAVGPTTIEGAEPTRAALTEPIRRRATVTTLTTSLAREYADLTTTRDLARALDVRLTLHAPYYVDFFGSPEARQRSLRQIQWAGVLAEGLGARLLVTHLGFYAPGPRADSFEPIREITDGLARWLADFGKGTIQLGLEPSGHPDVFGSAEEILELSHRVRGTVPVLNVPHLAARDRRPLERPEDYAPLVEAFRTGPDRSLYLNFAGVEYTGPGTMRLTPVKRGRIRFDPLAELLTQRDYDATVISSSPLLEHDAMSMKLIYERTLARRWARRHAPSPPRAAPAPAARATVSARASLAGPGRRARPSSGRPGTTGRPRPGGGKPRPARSSSRSRSGGGTRRSHGRTR